VIEGRAPGTLDFVWTHERGRPLGDVVFDYTQVPVLAGSRGELAIIAGAFDGTLRLDMDGNGTFETAMQPGAIRYRDVPIPPLPPDGPVTGAPGTLYVYSCATWDPETDRLCYEFDWGDGSLQEWQGPFPPGVACTVSHAWETSGTYPVRARARDDLGYLSDWSGTLWISISDITGVAPDSAQLRVVCAPNPSAAGMRIRFALAGPERVAIHVYDVSGRLVAHVTDRRFAAGIHTLDWTGTDQQGQRVVAGTDWVRLESPTIGRSVREVVIVR
jgi:hypothetical protein